MVLGSFSKPLHWSGEPSSKNDALGGKVPTYLLVRIFCGIKKNSSAFSGQVS
jgi:hypothetical protein